MRVFTARRSQLLGTAHGARTMVQSVPKYYCTADARQQMRRRMAEAHRFFLWDSAYGKGFEFVMRILQDLGQPKRAAKLPGKDQQHVRVHL